MANERKPVSKSLDAWVETRSVGQNSVIVDSKFAERLRSQHTRTFRVTAAGGRELTRDVPNVGDEALSSIDNQGIVQVGAEVRPGTMLVGLVEAREGPIGGQYANSGHRS